MYYIYQIKLDNYVIYIGRTNNPSARWSFHKTHETNKLLQKYFSQYDMSQFSFNIIYSDLTYAQAKSLEEYLIEEEQKINPYLANSDIGDKKSLEIKNKIATTVKRFWGSEQSILLRNKLNNTSKNRKKIYDIDTKLFFNSITEAAERLKVSRNTIYYRIKKKLIIYC